jgi:hypothetical protein
MMLRVAKSLALVSLAAGCAATAPPPSQPVQGAQRDERVRPLPPPRPRETVKGEAAAAAARRLFDGFFERIVEIEEHRSGPGYPALTHVTLYERPSSAGFAGLCEVTAHDVGVNFAAPPQEPQRTAEWVRSSTRFYAIGRVAPSPEPADQRARCSGLPTATTFFAAPSRERALLAMQMFYDARMWAEQNSLAASFNCAALGDQCRDPRGLFLASLAPQLISAVQEVPCEAGWPGRGATCFRYAFRPIGGLPPHGDWSVIIKGPERPMHVEIRQSQSPVV